VVARGKKVFMLAVRKPDRLVLSAASLPWHGRSEPEKWALPFVVGGRVSIALAKRKPTLLLWSYRRGLPEAFRGCWRSFAFLANRALTHAVIDSIARLYVPISARLGGTGLVWQRARTTAAMAHVQIHLVLLIPASCERRSGARTINDVAVSADLFGRRADNVLFIRKKASKKDVLGSSSADARLRIRKQRYTTTARFFATTSIVVPIAAYGSFQTVLTRCRSPLSTLPPVVAYGESKYDDGETMIHQPGIASRSGKIELTVFRNTHLKRSTRVMRRIKWGARLVGTYVMLKGRIFVAAQKAQPLRASDPGRSSWVPSAVAVRLMPLSREFSWAPKAHLKRRCSLRGRNGIPVWGRPSKVPTDPLRAADKRNETNAWRMLRRSRRGGSWQPRLLGCSARPLDMSKSLTPSAPPAWWSALSASFNIFRWSKIAWSGHKAWMDEKMTATVGGEGDRGGGRGGARVVVASVMDLRSGYPRSEKPNSRCWP